MNEIADLDFIPEMYGGTLSNSVVRCPKKVPKSVYWKPRKDYPDPKELFMLAVPAGKLGQKYKNKSKKNKEINRK